MQHARSSSRGFAMLISVLLLAGLAVTLFPHAARATSQLELKGTYQVGAVNRNATVDEARQRVYVTVDPAPGEDVPGAITWFDLATGQAATEQIQLPQTGPSDMVLSADGTSLYVVYNNSETVSIIDLDSGSVREVTGTPDWPSTVIEDPDSGLVYVVTSDGLTPIDPVQGTVGALISVSNEKYPNVKDAVYDSTNHMIWIAEGRASIITGYSTIADQWVDTIAVPVKNFEVDGVPVGGRPSILAMDEQLGELHIAVLPALADDWENTKVLSMRTSDTVYVGSPIEVGENTYEMAVNPATHDIVTTDGFSNVVSLISPDTWTVTQQIDFNAAGVTEGTGSGYADTWGLGITQDGSRIFVSHPYSDRLSEISRTGDAVTPTHREVAPGQDEGSETPDTSGPWEGPAAPEPSATPAGAQAAESGTLTWAINDYMQAWGPSALGTAVKQNQDYLFSSAKGWYDAENGTADLVWDGGIFIQHYPGMIPELTTTLGNPRLQIAADGTGTLSFDVAWSMSADSKSDGYARVTVATFSGAQVTVTEDSVTIVGTPDFTGRPLELDGRTYPDSYPAEFVEFLDPQMRAWWVTTGASMDANKTPLPFTVTATLAEAEPGGTAEGTADGTTGGGSDGTAEGTASGSAEGTADGTTGGTANGTTAADGSGSGADADGGSKSADAGGADPDQGVLSTTGGASATPWLIGAGGLVVVGALALLISARVRKQRADSEAGKQQ